MLILDILGIGFQAVVVFGLDKDLLFKSVLGHCGFSSRKKQRSLHNATKNKKN